MSSERCAAHGVACLVRDQAPPGQPSWQPCLDIPVLSHAELAPEFGLHVAGTLRVAGLLPDAAEARPSPRLATAPRVTA